MQSFDETSAKSWHGSKETILRKKSLELFQGLFALLGPKTFDAKLAKLKSLEALYGGLFFVYSSLSTRLAFGCYVALHGFVFPRRLLFVRLLWVSGV